MNTRTSRSSIGTVCLALLALAGWFGGAGCNCDGGVVEIPKWIIGEMTIDPATDIPATGSLEAEVSVRVFLTTEDGREPLPNVSIEIFSSRNQGGSIVDVIEQPVGKTDADGRAVAFLGSSTEGEAQIKPKADGADLCEAWENNQCVSLQSLVTFVVSCQTGETNCDGVCVDLQTDPANCGSCDNACAFTNATANCVDGVCEMGACDANYGDCNNDPSDGCESDLQADVANCGTCGNACDTGYICDNSQCVIEGDCDSDGDGYLAERSPCNGNDCDDTNPDIHPDAAEECDGDDNNCDGSVDEDPQGVICDDGNFCTDDTCIQGQGCVNVIAHEGEACDDLDTCTLNDICRSGQCIGDAKDEDLDGYVAIECGGTDCLDTDPLVNPSMGEGPGGDPTCSDLLDNDCDGATDMTDPSCNPCDSDDYCDDGNKCNGREVCIDMLCYSGTALDCDDSNPCTDNTCNPLVGCTLTYNNDSCDDADICTMFDACIAGRCYGRPLDGDGDGYVPYACGGLDCDDVDPAVNPGVFEGAPGTCDDGLDNDCDGIFDGNDLGCIDCAADADCIDGNACNGDETCSGGACQPGTPLACDDGDVCTNDRCDPSSGCVFVNNQAPCDDGDACTMLDYCRNGACLGDPMDADGDGHTSAACGGDDCDDGRPDVHPDMLEGAPGTCADGVDNDCDTFVDINDSGCVDCPDDAYCDDGNACNGAELCLNTPNGMRCFSGTPPTCDDSNECTDDHCDPATGDCVFDNNNLPCDDSDACTVGDVCSAGACQPGSTQLFCRDMNVCTDDTCDAVSGCVFVNNTDPCSDGNGCTVGDACSNGFCQPGSSTLVCDDGNDCTDDSCDPRGDCLFVNNSALCDDGDPCTLGDMCVDGACAAGSPKTCDDANVCTDDFCNPVDGTCFYNQNSLPCDDGNACTMDDGCFNGMCTGPPADLDRDGHVSNACGGADCDDSDPNVNPNNFEAPPGGALCTDGVDNDCDTLVDGNDPGCAICPDDAYCDDGNVCNGAETCEAGNCVAGTFLTCDDGDPCTDNSCDPINGCVYPNNNEPCDDGDRCTQTDTCAMGVCVGADPVVCTALSQCHDVGVCDSGTGVCSNPAKADGTLCDDNSLCTDTDICTAGACAGTPAVTCTAMDDCHDVGVCNPTTGLCDNPVKPDGAGCDDGDPCTLTDICSSATCIGSNPMVCTPLDDCHDAGVCDSATGLCSNPEKPDGSVCDDGDLCTQTDTCLTGVCAGADPVICTELDDCHDAGVCEPATGICSDPNKADGSPCYDGSQCTQTDTCVNGACVGQDPVVCTAIDTCHDIGTCNSSTGNCTNPVKADGAACDDGNLCTQTDTCLAGVCNGADPVVCTALDQCHVVGVCEPATGACTDPLRPDGTPCDDADACSQTDTCQAGVCTGADPVICAALDQCHVVGVCNPATGICSDPNQTDGTACDDGDACTQTDTCQTGVCTGANPVVCMPMDDCHDAGICNPATGVCTNPQKSDGAACDDGDACTQTDTCLAGSCQGANPVACTPLDQCHIAGVCNSATGICTDPAKADGTACDDADACTQTDTCQAGSCIGANPVICTAMDQCHDAGLCNPASGVCTDPAKTNGTPCDDGNLCTQTDTCQAGSCVGANPIVCIALDQCHVAGVCQPATGNCTNPEIADGTPCVEADACSTLDTCQSGLCVNGVTNKDSDGDSYLDWLCVGGTDCDDNEILVNPGATEGPFGDASCSDGWDNDCDAFLDMTDTSCMQCLVDLDCDDAEMCTTDTCVAGVCDNTALGDGTGCDDGDLCTQTDTCQAGVCTGANPVICTALDQCHVVGTCNSATGACTNPSKADGATCDDGDACFQTDTCQSGSCVGSDPVVCAPLDQCHVAGICQPATGVCTDPAKVDGTPCDDLDACTQTDTCQSGNCTGADPVICAASDQCHDVGVCNPGTGVCSDPPKTDGTACDDGDACTQTDTCQSGSCTGANPVICSALDQCHVAGVCQPATGNCTNPDKADGTACDDLDACTQTDECQSGNCVGLNPVVCVASDQCHVAGVCNPATGVCTDPDKADDSPCDDGDLCTQTDTCQAGNCVGADPVVCTALDQCHVAGLCQPATGNCTNPNQIDGTACDDSDACTQTDTCQAGACVGANPVVCTASDQCHLVGVCNSSTGICSDPPKVDGSACDDANACTQTDECQAGTCTGSNPVICTASDQCHDVGVCDSGTGICSNPNKANGSPCDDLDACTQTDTCQIGNCVGVDPVICTALDQCHDVGVCNSSTGNCSNPEKLDGTGCDDGDLCTQTDSCQSGTCTGANPVLCTPLDQCHDAGVCVPGTGNCTNPQKSDGTLCNDGDNCSSQDTCQAGICTTGPTDKDTDTDTYLDANCPGGNDCDDTRGFINPGEVEAPYDTPVCLDSFDNDCDTFTDIADTGCMECLAHADCDDGNVCTSDLCLSGECQNNPVADGTFCDDSDACTQTDSCQAGTCTGANPVICTASDQCHLVGACDSGTGVCSDPQKVNGSPCDDSDACTQTDTCQAGNCVGADPVVCTALDQCHDVGVCQPATGNCTNPNKTDGTACDDGDACTQTDTCQAGTCTGANPVVCTALDQCHVAGVCQPATGNCTNPNKADGSSCDDGDACTQTDTCQSGSCVGADPVVCTPLDQCHDAGVCQSATGTCTNPNKANGSSCDDGDDCTQTDECQVGICVGADPVICTALDQCHDVGVCNPATGTCSNPNKTDGSACDDGNACTQTDTCQTGSCQGADPVVCTALDQCHVAGVCQPATGNCTNPNKADGASCDDGDLCTQTDTCQSGTCTGADPVVCTALDQCHDAGVCIPATGVCTDPNKADGTGCDDSDACTQTDTCQTGICVGADPVICTALDQCHDVGVCNSATGICSDPNKTDGTACDDGDLCTQTDTCQAGTCTGANPVTCSPLDQCHVAGVCQPATGNCTNPNKSDGSSCDDGNLCTQTDTCQSGSCTGANPVTCSPLDQCHLAGTCQPATGICTDPNKVNGSPCDDGDQCTQTDTCQTGVCVGADPVVCVPLDQCHNVGVCNSATGICTNPLKTDGTPCNDGNICSTLDTCIAGTCTAGATNKDTDGDTYLDALCPGGNDCNDNAITINPGAAEGPFGDSTCGDTFDNDCDSDTDMDDTGCMQCIVDGDCDDANVCTTDACVVGVCQNVPVADGTGCDDSNACTQTDTCQSGNCTGANPVVCTPLDQCHNAGTCNPFTGICTDPNKPNGTPCNDLDACTQTDTCVSGNCTGANPVVCTALDQCHDVGVCNTGSGVCSNPNKADGTGCDDGNACTQTDTCQAGSCLGVNPVVCTPLDQCHDVGVCNPGTGICTDPNKANGSPCDDGNGCTQTDTCQSGTCAGADPVVCTPLDQCHNAGVCQPASGTCTDPNKADGTSCDDGDLCTQTDTCQSGNCTGANPVVCTASDQCHDAGTCAPGTGVCSDPEKVNGTACNDGDLCTQTDTCQSGTCTGADPVVCTPSDQCHDAGVCNSGTGICSDPQKSDGTSCADGDACTQTDTCQAGVCTGSNPVVCTPLDQCHDAGTCQPATGVCTDPNKTNGTGCDDGDACTQTDTCQSGVCTGANPVVCTASDQCHDVGICNSGTGVCSDPAKTDGTACNDGNACTQTDECQSGTCTGSNSVVCTASDQCHDVGVCQPASGTCTNPNKSDGTPCDDTNACTQTDECQSGACAGSDPVVCTPSDQCHDAGVCLPASGTCTNPNKTNGTACDDGDLCTQTDTCQTGSCVGANPVVCTPLDQCHNAGVCQPATGNCTNPSKTDGTACDDGDGCSTLDTCIGGSCTTGATNKDTDGDTYFDWSCPLGDDCNDSAFLINPGATEGPYGDSTCTDTFDNDCDTLADMSDTDCMQCIVAADCEDFNVCTNDACVGGVCQNNPVVDGTGCNDGDLCTQTDECQSGACTGLNPVVCTALDQCHNAGVCNPATGTCTDPAKPDGTSCDDGTLCTQTDTCQSGVCNGADPVVCTVLDQCHVLGVCNPATGTCSNPSKPDGSACDDGDLCTQTDTCQSGSCVGANPVTCTPLDQCHDAGVCQPATGNCTNPNKSDGSSCDDGDLCTQTDTCQSGACVGANLVTCTPLDQCHVAGVCQPATGNCTNPNKADGTACDDGDACTQTDECQSGSCTGLNPVVCTALDQCHDVGLCQPATGTCTNPNKTDGTGCDDGDLCTQTDTCQSGTCVGANPVTCTPLDQCHDAGVCQPASGTCTNPNKTDGTSCDDGNACTQTDTCQSGSCTGANPVTCTPLDQCHDAGVCQPASGTCTNPNKTDGTSCDDGNLCTQTDTCQAGNCVGANPVVCTPLDQCHDAGVCNPGTGVCTDPNKTDGASCDDGNLCTQTDTCQSGTCVGANPVNCTPLDQCHDAGVCQPATGNCTNPNKTDGTSCDDGNACTQTDTCQSGSCTGANPVACTPLDQCHDAGVCNPGTGICSNPNKTDGSACDDGNFCTQTDTCQSGNCTGANPVVCTALDQCHNAGICNPGTGICTNPNKPNGTACNDGDPCSTLDTCQNGSCTTGATNKDTDGDTFLDGLCPGGDDCMDNAPLINPGATEGPFGDATCADTWDNDCDTFVDIVDTDCMQCIVNGDCDDSNVCTTDICSGGVCQNNPVANGTGCNDGDLCTQTDTCQAGVCTGANPVVCTPLDQCHVAGVCQPATGNCTNPNKADGSACNDGDLCTQTDTCQSGTCTGANPVVCTASDQCHNAGICNPATGFCTDPAKPNGTACDDGDLCTQTDTCQGGACTGANPVVCTASDQCHNVGICNPGTGVCTDPAKPDGAGCNDGDACTQTDTCQTGSCVGADPVVCTPSDQCHDAGTCNPGTGVCTDPAKANGTGCDDGDACTQTDTCQGGVCNGANPVVCTASDQCHDVGTCNPGTGVCSDPAKANGTACDDGDACTQTDTCQSGSCTGANPVVCTPSDQCHNVGICNPGTGVCSDPAKPDGSGCNDGDACTQTDTCQSGTCSGADPIVCTPLDQCHDAGICNPGTGVCTDPARANGTGCDDGDLCTQTDTCQGGVCTGANPVVCTASDQCHDVGTCNPGTGICSDPAKPNGTACDDGDLCTQTDTCQTGSCTGANPVVCTPSDQCHDVGVCNPGTGVCSDPAKPNGTACNDGDLCTQTDTCQSGACTGADPVVCTPLDQCHDAGTCNPGTGICTDPNKTNGTPCDDGDLCTQTDTCQGGACTGADPVVCTPLGPCYDAGVCDSGTGVCSNPKKSNGDPCDDGDPCSTLDTCLGGTCRAGDTNKDTDGDTYFDWLCPDGDDCDDDEALINPGETEGPFGDATCSDVWDNDCDTFADMTDTDCMQCTGDGECDDSNVCTTDTCVAGVCNNNPVANGTGCDDSDLCTQTDTCQGGVCTGANPVVCSPLDQCHIAGVCNPATGNCTNPQQPNGSPCDDVDLCTQTDTCQTGVCVGANPVVCTASDQCHDVGVCNPGTGICTDPAKANGTACNDGDLCTQTDECQAGVCTGLNPVVCTPQDQCHVAGVCNPATGNCSNPQKSDGSACNDGDLCTQTDECQSGNCIGSNPVVCTASDQCHVAGVCNPGTGVCSDPAKSDGTGCDDSDACTQTDTCQAGVCTGADPIVCTASDQCHDAGICNPGTGVCSDPQKSNGSACDDGDFCTQTDTCQSGVCTGANPVVCTASDQCHNAGTCNPGTGICSDPQKPDGTGCNDGDLCTQTDTCQAGTCTGANPVVCTASDQCHNAGTCNPGTGVCSDPAKADGSGCDDGDLCTQTDTCQSGVCTGADPVVCTPSDQCHDAGTCNPGTGACTDPQKPNGSACNDGDLCTQTDECIGGVCTGSNPVTCTALDQCHVVGVCQPATGNCTNPNASDGTGCDDGNLCTQTDTCQSGACTGANPVVCTPLDQCHNAGVCNPGTGTCTNPTKPNGTSCNDGDPCSSLDTCQGGACTAGATNKDTDGDTYLDGACPGGDDCDDDEGLVNPGEAEGPFGDGTCADTWDNDCDTFIDDLDTDCMQCTGDPDCDDGNDCTNDSCVAGACLNPPVGDGTGCDDGDGCTQTDTCQTGVCVGANPVVCTPLSQCHNAGVCNPGTGLCTNPTKPDGTGCDDGDACTQTDECQSGACTGLNPVVCTASDQCHNVGTCNPANGICSDPPKPDGTGCDDGNACTQTDTCQIGSCTGANPVVCTPSDQCHNAGTCNPGTGICSDPAKPDGSGCDDGNACTQTDTCQSGTCSGANPVVCTASDQCHNAGTCNPGTGVCTDPEKPDGTGCDDGDLCTQTDECQSGNCTGLNPVVCSASDQCHNVGTCNPGTGVCTDPAKPDGTGCDDGDACTQTDTCQTGTCEGADPVVCTASDQCHNAGTCNPGTGVCSDPAKPDGTGCDDSDACTQTDECQSGTCTGLNPVVCTPLDQCHNAGTCNPGTGVCTDPDKPDGTGCDDGDLCTQTDECQSGTCTGLNPVVCTASDQCHDVGTCNPGTGICSDPAKIDGTSCDDVDECTQTDTCQTGVCTGADPVVCTASDQCHNVGTCNSGTGICSDPQKPDDTPCDDGDFCTQTDTCQVGICTGADPVVCTQSDPCHDVGICNPGTGICSDPAKPNGAACDDGDLCTHTDECWSGVCTGTAYSCNDYSPCTIDSCNGDGTCTNTVRADPWNDPLHQWTETTCDSNDNDCDGCIDENCAGYSMPIVAVEVIPYSTGPDLRRISGNGQFAPIGQELHNDLIVQLNNGSGVPIKGQMITFLVEPLTDGIVPESPSNEGICYGDDTLSFSCSGGRHCPIPVMKLCNNSLGTLIDSGGTPGSTFDVPTDDNGQARIRFRLSSADTGFHVVSATYAGPPVQTLYFFSASATQLADSITVATAGNQAPAINPALGPLNVTRWSNDGNRPTDLGYFDSYQLAITGLSTDNNSCFNGEFPQEDITVGGDLYICGQRFSTSGNTVWVGGVQASIVSQSATLIRVTYPEGLPGAAAVIVDDGTSTIAKDDHATDDSSATGFGWLPSRAAAMANFVRMAPKPISIYAQTGTQAGSNANVKLLGLDECGNPLDLSGHSLTLAIRNPDKAGASNAMTVTSPNASTGIATVNANSSTVVRAGVVMGTVNGITSDSMVDGNTVVSAVPRTAPTTFTEDPSIGFGGNADGINSMIIRGSDESDSATMEHQNPAIRMQDGAGSVELITYRLPWGGTPFETEANIALGTMTGQGDLANLHPDLTVSSAVAGTEMGVVSGGASGAVVVLAATVGIDVAEGDDPTVLSVPATVLPGWLRSPGPGGDQEMESFVNTMLFFEEGAGGYPRAMSIRLFVIRSMP